MLQYLDAMKEARTGQTAASQGLDPDVLQSTTKAAVTATVSSAATSLRQAEEGLPHRGTEASGRPRAT